MSRLILTDVALRALKPAKREIYFDASTPGFAVRVTPAGTKTFVIVHGPERARKWEKIGTYPLQSLAKAREEARNRLSAIQLGIKPAAPIMTFAEAYTLFLASYTAKNRAKTVYEMERIARRHLLPKLQHRSLDEISTQEVATIVDRLLPTPAECAATFTAARTIFRWIARRRLIEQSPLENVPLPVKNSARERVLTPDELRTVWNGCHSLGNLNPDFAAIVRLLILTGQRKGQIVALRGDWIDRSGMTITWPAEIMKGGRAHTIPLARMTMTVLDTLPQRGLLFRARGRETPFNGFSKCKAAFDQRAKITPWTLHDLRRTFSTSLAELRVLPHIKEMILAHSTAKDPIERIYDLHTYLEEMREALARWEDHLAALVERT